MNEEDDIPMDETPAPEPNAEPPAREKDYTFFNQRLLPIGWTPERNVVTLHAADTGDGKERKYDLFDVDEKGNILINYYRINGQKAEYRTEGAKWSKHYQVKRLQSPVLDKHNNPVKYVIPRGAGTFAWFPPELIQAYHEHKQLDVLVLTEGAFKAFCASGYGLPIVGLTSISHYKDKASGTLHPDVIELLRRCRPKEVVWLVDGDCKNLTSKWPEDPDKDLAQRPNLFYSSAKNIGILLKDHARTLGFNTWFMHVKSDAFTMPQGEEDPKGLDDQLLAYVHSRACKEEPLQPVMRKPEQTDAEYDADVQAYRNAVLERREKWKAEHGDALRKELLADLCDVSKPPRFFERRELERPVMLREYFHLRSAQDFYTNYQDRIAGREFVFDGTKYKWEEPAGGGQGELKVKVPSVAKNYVRVGTEYYKRIKVPNKFGDLEEKLVNWKRPTIVEDHGKNFCEHVLKLEAFCNVPDHVHYQEILKSCLNTYGRFEHEADEHADPPEHTLKFLAHIFGKGTVKVPHPKKEENGVPVMIEVSELDLGLDYLQLLYKKPTQMLPIVCLVSKERGTGKTTFFKFIKQLLTSNCCFVGGKDFESDFNEHYASKKVIILDEALVDKQLVVEKMKALSTGDKIMVNAKGRPQYEQDFFGCFIMGSNNVRSFIKTDDDETRFWVRLIQPIPAKDLDTELEAQLYKEIPAFLHLLNTRTMATEKLYRSHFHPPLLNTVALQEVRAHSQPMVRKHISRYMRDMLIATQAEEILMGPEDINREVFRGRSDADFITEVVTQDMHLHRYKNAEDREVSKRYSYPRFDEEKDAYGNIGSVLRWIKPPVGRPFVFDRSSFFKDEEWKLLQVDEADGGAAAQPTDAALRAQAMTGAQGDDDDLPF